MKTEIELLQYLESNSLKNILKYSYDELLNEVNKGNVSISNYLYGKLFFEKSKGIKFINNLGIYFPNQNVDIPIRDSNIKNENNNIIEKNTIDNIKNNEDDFFDDIEESEEFNNIKSVDLTTKVDSYELNDIYFNKLKENQHDSEVIAQIINSNQKLVMKIASRYKNSILGSILDIEDLVSSGNLGLYKAIQKFDISKGYQFSTYATWWIKQKITRDIADRKLTIRLPVHIMEKLNKLNRIYKIYSDIPQNELVQKYMKELNVSEEKLFELLYIDKQFNTSLISLASSTNEDGSSQISDFIRSESSIYEIEENTPENLITKKIFRDEMESIFKEILTDKQIDILKRRSGWEGEVETLEEIGLTYKVTRERIRQIESTAMAKLRKKLEKMVYTDIWRNFNGLKYLYQ
ncbi:sigma-70 family RNA polymerase sigma factor [Staphylococcus pseudintermedius]|uniref:sigma-70 family RNA polymerase sigma factor n=1 Tax=Staphylococcus pseudintermedius TaxID=283734 RepID=UPI0018F356B1|nr:sigma-70 family RNA polymerase sigma factor [Staphylococcus pseudintermedius]MBJ8310544.1 sigma-70 family RNA polymerase sigma factor [Staphylococcus pseudintermedius]